MPDTTGWTQEQKDRLLDGYRRTIRYWLTDIDHITLIAWSCQHIDVSVNTFGQCPYTLREKRPSDRFTKNTVTHVLQTQNRGFYEYRDLIPISAGIKEQIDGIITKYGEGRTTNGIPEMRASAYPGLRDLDFTELGISKEQAASFDRIIVEQDTIAREDGAWLEAERRS